MPDLVGLSKNEAVRQLKALHIKPEIRTQMSAHKPDTVLESLPVAGELVGYTLTLPGETEPKLDLVPVMLVVSEKFHGVGDRFRGLAANLGAAAYSMAHRPLGLPVEAHELQNVRGKFGVFNQGFRMQDEPERSYNKDEPVFDVETETRTYSAPAAQKAAAEGSALENNPLLELDDDDLIDLSRQLHPHISRLITHDSKMNNEANGR
ncbi:PASTA domain-containing protein [Streptacidiphilus rugosus]|uniref:PASTA domain-containing protein n=1 Tax=Streptacidiphilus rugosus TaxID=405783 RepID=UPI000B1D7A36|nr:PASTA domain-containing protein [Streptacidiphilus rugosus]